MKFVLKDSFIHIVNSEGLANNKLEAEVVTKYVDGYHGKRFHYKINNKPFEPVRDNKIVFLREDYEHGVVNLAIKATDSQGNSQYFKADRIPVTFAVIFGKRIEEAYPEVLRHLLERMDRLDVVLTNIIDAMAEVDKKGDLF